MSASPHSASPRSTAEGGGSSPRSVWISLRIGTVRPGCSSSAARRLRCSPIPARSSRLRCVPRASPEPRTRSTTLTPPPGVGDRNVRPLQAVLSSSTLPDVHPESGTSDTRARVSPLSAFVYGSSLRWALPTPPGAEEVRSAEHAQDIGIPERQTAERVRGQGGRGCRQPAGPVLQARPARRSARCSRTTCVTTSAPPSTSDSETCGHDRRLRRQVFHTAPLAVVGFVGFGQVRGDMACHAVSPTVRNVPSASTCPAFSASATLGTSSQAGPRSSSQPKISSASLGACLIRGLMSCGA